VREVLSMGAVAGYPVVDVRVIVYDGKYHSVDSKEIAFVTAGKKAFMAAIREARPVVLEPIVQSRSPRRTRPWATSPGDLSSKRGLVTGTANGAPGTMVVRGQVPMSELAGYQSRLNAMTSGQGRYSHRTEPLRSRATQHAAATDVAVQAAGRRVILVPCPTQAARAPARAALAFHARMGCRGPAKGSGARVT
jgi:translation elongation factor EF-G